MIKTIKTFLKYIASLHLTVALLAFATVLVYVGTLAQVDAGIWAVQKKYFHSFIVLVDVWALPFPLPGGYTIGGLLLINSVAAHLVRFKLSWKRTGIILIHFSLILLLVGELFTSLQAIETQMTLDEGQTMQYTYDIREMELVLIDPSNAAKDRVVTIPPAKLKDGAIIEHEALPFNVRVNRYFVNTTEPRALREGERTLATVGVGLSQVIEPLPPVSGVGESTVNLGGGYVTIEENGRSLGTYLVSYFYKPQVIKRGEGQEDWLVAMRFRRYYKPYSITLLDFKHDRYIGTNTPRNFSSLILLNDPGRGVIDQQKLIWMNHPLRHAGETFFQASFRGETISTLQVVQNPVWRLPYIACLVGGLGMVIHFSISLWRFAGRTSR